jgi:hypothetical protein
MLKISSQRLPIHFTSNYTFRNRISYILIYLRNIHDYYFKNRNFKLIIILTTKSYLKGIFASLMMLTNKSFKSCVFATNISYKAFLRLLFFCTHSLNKIYPSLFLDTLRQKWWFHSFVYHIFIMQISAEFCI